ncbi:hypothetical protein CYMTET_26717 [Cymbomonas tetramitiformis]|uniref:Uncharacterized protein n=1 Tax=Cymbomonas tetramitiformis TaxID=36881 RepID=A0AAE0KXN3_9CHLO|nr:hypothetical protein CYMTET_26717 [Cymbomonas tetramitiformis]
MLPEEIPIDFKRLEVKLLLTSLGSNSKSGPPVSGAGTAEELVGLIENAQYQEVLRSDTASTLLPLPSSFGGSSQDDVASAAKKYYDKVRSALSSYLSSAESTTDKADRHLQALAVGVAALYIFLQTNFTGPPMRDVVGAPYELRGAPRGPNMDDWAMQELAADGEDPIGRYRLPQYLLTARILLVEPRLPHTKDRQAALQATSQSALSTARQEGGLLHKWPLTGAWWAARTLAWQQRLLSRRSPTLRVGLLRLFSQILQGLASEDAPIAVGLGVEAGLGRQVHVAALLEAALMEYMYDCVDAGEATLKEALKVAGVEFKLSGVLGKRTEHQVESKAQLVLTVERAPAGEEAGGWESDEEEMVRKDAAAVEAAPQDAPAVEAPAPSPAAETDSGDSAPVVEGEQPVRREGTGENKLAEFGIKDESNVIEAGPRLDSAEGATTLRSLEQALVLAHCTSIKRSSADDELQGWEMAPYVDAVRSQRCTRPLFSVVCNLLQARFEKARGRTRERALLRMEALVEEVQGASLETAAAAQRMRYAFSVWLPPWLSLRKEWGEMLLSFGFVGPAMSLFEGGCAVANRRMRDDK